MVGLSVRNGVLLTAALLLLFVQAPARSFQDDDDWDVAKTYFAKHPGVKVYSGKKVLGACGEGNEYFFSMEERGGWLQVHYLQNPATGKKATGWVRKSDVVEYPQSVQYFTARIKKDPRDSHAWYGRSISVMLARGSHTKQSLADHNEALRLTPKAEWHRSRGYRYAAEGDHARAISDYLKAIKLNPKLQLAWYQLGEAYQARGDYAQAAEQFAAAIQLHPKDYPAYKVLGASLCELGRYAESIDALNVWISQGGGWANAQDYNYRGWAYDRLGQFDWAIADFSEAIRLLPDYTQAYLNRGISLSQKKEYDLAIRDFTEVIRLDPATLWGYYNRGLSWHEKGEYRKALNDYAKAIAANPTEADPLISRGWTRYNMGDYGAALQDYQRALALKPDDVYTYGNIAWVRATCPDAKLRDGASAIELARRACEATQNEDSTWLRVLAAAHAERGDFAAAIQWQTKAVAHATPALFAECQEMMAEFRGKRPFRQAQRGLGRLELAPGNVANADAARQHLSQGIVWANAGEHDKAIVELTEAIRLDPSYAAAAYGLRGLMYQIKGEVNLAKADMVKAGSLETHLTSGVDIAIQYLNQRSGTEQVDPELYKQVLAATAWVATFRDDQPQGAATGWLVDRQHRRLVTNKHVARDGRTLYVYFPVFQGDKLVTDSKYYSANVPRIPARVLVSDPRLDLAVLELDSLPDEARALPLSNAGCRVHEIVHALGNSAVGATLLWSYHRGKVVRAYPFLISPITGFGNLEAAQFHMISDIIPGDSGGPIVNDRGELVGVTCAADVDNPESQHHVIGVDVVEVKELLRRIDAPVSSRQGSLIGRWKSTLVAPAEQVERWPPGSFTFFANGTLEGRHGDIRTGTYTLNGDSLQIRGVIEVTGTVAWQGDDQFTLTSAAQQFLFTRR